LSPGIIKFSVLSFVIVALIFTLIGILGSQQEEAKRAAGIRNLKQWGIALNLYLIENDNQLPEVGKAPVTSEQKRAWFNVLPPYLSEPALANLPAAQRPRPGIPSLWIRPDSKAVKIWDPEVFYFNYGMNENLQPTAGARSFRIYELGFPSHIFFLLPTADFAPSARPDNTVFSQDEQRNLGATVLFCDGHVETLLRSLVLDPVTFSSKTAGEGPSWYGN